MKKLSTLTYVFWESLTKPGYYINITTAKFSFSLKYLYLLLSFSSLLLGVKFALGIAGHTPQIPDFIEKTKIVLSQIYPEELIITVKDRKISTNVQEPYFISVPKEMVIPEKEAKYLVAIDTSADIADFDKYQSLFLLSKEFVAMKDNSTGYKVQALDEILKDVPDGATMKNSDFNALAAGLDPYYRYIYPAVYAFIIMLLTLWPLLVAGVGLTGKLIMLVFSSLLLFIFAKILKRGLTYKNIYQMSMHGLTLSVLISTFLTLVNFSFPYISLFAFLAWMMVVIWKQKNLVVESAE
ncbi:MAG: DUF1189 family protein [bacterium]|nr:DUF1189 family protein [bacterium]